MTSQVFLRSPRPIVVCPRCRHALEGARDLRCTGCGQLFPQSDARWVDLLPDRRWAAADGEWGRRQHEMERAYDELAADPAHAILAYHHDLGGYRERLAACAGAVLDVGGGQGLVRHFLPPGVDYVVLDPSTSWFHQPWPAISDTFPCLSEPLAFVRGIGERMPFPDERFDWVLTFWSLNHAEDPAAVLGEAARVLKPGGRMLMSLDDVPPSWRDILSARYVDHRFSTRSALARVKAASALGGWPLQSDHIRIRERDLRRWTAAFVWEERAWVGSYFTLVLQKK